MKIMMPPLSNLRQLGLPKALVSLAVGILILLSAGMFLRWWVGPKVQIDTLALRDFVQTVVASGHVENPHRVELGAQLTGTVKRVPVAEGQLVQQDQVLIELENSELRATLQQAELSVVQAEAKIRQLNEVQAPVQEQSYKQALANQDTSHNALSRAQDLFAKGFIGQAALDEALRNALVAKSQVLSLKAQVASLHLDGSEHASAQANLSQAHASVELAQARLRYAQIRAPSAGVLISRNVEPGDVVQPGKILMTLSPVGTTELIAQIDEKHLGQLKLGQTAVVSADAYSAEHFDAVLSYINPGIDLQRGAVTIKLQVPHAPSYLRQDMTVSLNIETVRRQQVLLVANQAIHDIDHSPWVMMVRNGKTSRQAIQLGMHGADLSEVVSGLQSGDTLVHDGMYQQKNARVRPQ
jgi:HlyD family secretion protein